MLPLLSAVMSVGVDAIACGGFFCNQTPVMQTGEKIIFAVDHEANTVDVIIEIAYSGDAEDFAWVLPLASAPTHMGIGTTRLFTQIDAQTAPSFQIQAEYGPKCQVFAPHPAGSDAGAFASMDAGPGNPVVVLAQEQVGPYDSVVIQSRDPQAIRDWLEAAEYDVTDQMMESVRPYVIKGDALLALKLAKSESAGSLQPFAVRLNSTEPCIPLRMTAIAASTDMAVTALVLSKNGRAIPANYLHVEPNFARINWTNAFSSYRDLISDAANEGGGNAFTTEYAGPSDVLARQIYRQGEYNLGLLRSTTNLGDFITQLAYAQLNRRSELVGVLRKHIPDSLLLEAEIMPEWFWPNPGAYTSQLTAVSFDPNPAVDDIEERIIEPDRDAQALFDRFPDLTRLYTLLSPIEMNVDPIFEFREGLPNVTNVHRAKVTYECGDNGQWWNAKAKVELEDGTSYYMDSSGQPDVGPQPAALLIQDLKDGRIVMDNRKKVGEMAEQSIANNARAESCTCDASGRDGAFGALAFLIVAAIAGAARRRRKE